MNEDELDKKLYNDLNLTMQIPDKLDNIIKEALNNKVLHHSLSKIAIVVCTTIIATVGVVYAGTIIYDKVWKDPEKIVGFYTEGNNIQNTITEQQKDDIMSETEARKKVEELLKKFECDNEKIEMIELQNNTANYELSWSIKTNKNTSIWLEAKEGKSFGISIDNVLYEDIDNYRTTEKEAEQTARSLCKKYGYDLKEYNYTKITSNMNSEKDSYIWHVIFCKKYDEIVNYYESIDISFIPVINKIYGFSVTSQKFDNNLVEITKQQAREIALKEEEKISTKYNIKNIDIQLDIVSMNGLAYLRINDYDQLYNQTSADYPSEKWVTYRTENRIRKAWVVTIIYHIPDTINKHDKSYNKNEEQFSYYIDATTGEIIGGSCIYKKYQ